MCFWLAVGGNAEASDTQDAGKRQCTDFGDTRARYGARHSSRLPSDRCKYGQRIKGV